MRISRRTLVLVAITVIGLADIVLGLIHGSPMVLSAGAVGTTYALLQFTTRAVKRRSRPKPAPLPEPVRRPVVPSMPVSPDDTEGLARQMMGQGRYALLLRPQIATNLSEETLEKARDQMHDAMALVPQGEVVLGCRGDEEDGEDEFDRRRDLTSGRIVPVAPLLLDRYPVTNREYFDFVAAGGYEQMALWDPAVLPELLRFVDQTKQPGPAFWVDGCFEDGKERHPVVGVSWYEARAYAKWVGKRLPTDAEWVKAGSWPVRLSASKHAQRKYPWGDAMDRSLAALWDSDRHGTVAVDELAEGASIGGVYHLIGNVWEWMHGAFHPIEALGADVELEVPLKSIRGGAFDTYFDNQATCHFQSGDAAIARRHNIGFRCAIGICDLALVPLRDEPEDVESELPEEVHA